MDCEISEELFNEIIEYDGDHSDANSEKENKEFPLTKQRPPVKQYQMMQETFDKHGKYDDIGKECYDELWSLLAERLNDNGPPQHSQLEWRRKWSVYKYKTKIKPQSTKCDKRRYAVAQPSRSKSQSMQSTTADPLDGVSDRSATDGADDLSHRTKIKPPSTKCEKRRYAVAQPRRSKSQSMQSTTADPLVGGSDRSATDGADDLSHRTKIKPPSTKQINK